MDGLNVLDYHIRARKTDCHSLLREKPRKYNSSVWYPNTEKLGWQHTPVYVYFHDVIINRAPFHPPKHPYLDSKVYGHPTELENKMGKTTGHAIYSVPLPHFYESRS